jgi:type I restriction enzyme R subunit
MCSEIDDIISSIDVNSVNSVDGTKEAFTQLFFECKVGKTPVIVERIVKDIDQVVKVTRFDGWQWTKTGEETL